MRSKVLAKLLKNNIGYRTESFSGSKARNIEDIIRFEISMGNTDIIRYLQENYGILKSYLEKDYNEEFSYICQENAVDITEEIIKFLTKFLSTENKNLMGLWLTDYQGVINVYRGKKENIDKFHIPCKFIVISDLDKEGSLFVFNRKEFLKLNLKDY